MTSTPATLTVTLVDGTQVVVPDSLDQITPYVLQEQGDWFEDEIKFLRRLVQPGQSVIDIGANVGVYALSLARKVGPTGQVWAFEPASTTADLLAESIAANGTSWLQLQCQALSDHTGTAWLQTPGQSELNSLATNQQGPGEEVALTTLDACLDTFGWQQVDLLKIDAEGEEERILAGGRRFFSELSPLVMFELKAGTELHLELVERFQALGYSCYRLVPGLDALMPFDPAAGVDGYLLNLFAAKPNRAEALAAGGWLVPTASPEPPGSEELKPYHWSYVLTQLPYGQALAATWEQHASSEKSTAAAKPLALWAYAQDSAQPIDRRLGALQRSYSLLSEQARDKQRLTSLSSLPRVASDLGERIASLRALGHLIPGMEAPAELELKEPFLPPCSRFDALDPAGHLAEWLAAAALESDELLGHFSGFFSGTKARPRLERLQTLGFAGTAMQQRLSLLNRRFPPRPPASPELERRNPEQITCSQQAFELIQAGEIEQGKQLLAQAEQLGDTCSIALHLIARGLIALGDRPRAMSQLQRAVELDPENAAALLELGICLKSMGEPAAAEAVFQQVLWVYSFMMASVEPTAGAYSNLGIAYQQLGDMAQAIEHLDRALELEQDFTSALYHKGEIFHNQKDRHDDAMSIWERLQALQPENPVLMAHCATILTYFGEAEKAITLLEQAFILGLKNSSAHHSLAFAHSIAGESAVKAHLQHLRSFWEQFRANTAENDHSPVSFSLPTASQKLRVAFLTAELGDHVVGRFLEPFLTHYDRSRFEVELIETLEYGSRKAAELAQLADAVLTVQGMSLREARQRIRSRGYGVIVETSGFTRNNGLEILASRCAPVQCHYIGFHASTGLNTIDWFIGDDLTAGADLADQFVERLWRLPRLWLACCRPSHLPDARSTRQGSPPVLGSFNQFAKVRRETLRFWAAALHRIPEAELHLKNFTTDSPRPRQRIVEELSSHGIDPQRVVFLHRTATRQEHLASYGAIDVALDTTPWAGATTTVDALLMGVPVVGILGNTTASRMGCSILRALGREQWIATSPEAFAEAAAKLLQDPDALRAEREQLRQAVLNSPLFDGADLTHHLQEAFISMVTGTITKPPSSETFQPMHC